MSDEVVRGVGDEERAVGRECDCGGLVEARRPLTVTIAEAGAETRDASGRAVGRDLHDARAVEFGDVEKTVARRGEARGF